MKKIPAKYELTQEDIEAAIIDWLNTHPEIDGDGHDFKVTLKVKTEQTQPKLGPIGGMTDPIITEIFSAVAERLD